MAELDYNYIGELVEMSRGGNSDAFAELYAATYQKQYYAAYKYLKDEYLAQDALQETYISALKNINSLKDPTLFVAWLNQICFHICYDISRKDKGGADSISTELLELCLDEKPEHNPDEHYENQEEIEQLKKAVASLPFLEQQVIVMRFYNEMKIEDIAAALKCSRSTIKRHINNGRDALKKMLERRSN